MSETMLLFVQTSAGGRAGVRTLSDITAAVTGGAQASTPLARMRCSRQVHRPSWRTGQDVARAEKARRSLRTQLPLAGVYCVAGSVDLAEHATRRMEAASRDLGCIDVLVNSTGGTDFPWPMHETALDDIACILERTLLSQITSYRAASPCTRAADQGSVINTASDSEKLPPTDEAVIGASMTCIVMFTLTLPHEGLRKGIRANVVTPSLTIGTRHHDAVVSDPFTEKLMAKATTLAALGCGHQRRTGAARRLHGFAHRSKNYGSSHQYEWQHFRTMKMRPASIALAEALLRGPIGGGSTSTLQEIS